MHMFQKSGKRILASLLAYFLLIAANAAMAAAPAQNVWLQTSPLLSPRTGAGVIEVDGVIYAIGGVDGREFLTSSESSAIHKDGSLAPWRAGDAHFFGSGCKHRPGSPLSMRNRVATGSKPPKERVMRSWTIALALLLCA